MHTNLYKTISVQITHIYVYVCVQKKTGWFQISYIYV